MKSIIIYTTNTCAYCKMVKKWLSMRGYEFEEINLDQHPEKQAEAFALSGALTVPITVVKSGESSQEIVVGWNLSRLAPALS